MRRFRCVAPCGLAVVLRAKDSVQAWTMAAAIIGAVSYVELVE